MFEIMNNGRQRPYLIQMADMPYTASHTVTTVRNGELYVLGGLSASLTSLNTFAAFDPNTFKWRSLSPYPELTRSPAIGSFGGKISVAGGYSQGTAVPSRNIRDFTTGWTLNQTALAQPKFDAGYTEVDGAGNMYVLGGNVSGAYVAEFVRINISGSAAVVTAMAPYSVAVRQTGMAIYNGMIYALGGVLTDGSSTNLFRVYDIAQNKWTTLPACPSTCSHANLVVKNDRIYALFPLRDTTEGYGNYLYVYDLKSNSWEYLGNLPGIICGLVHGSVIGDHLYLCGGWNGTTRHNHTMRLTVPN